MPLLHHVGGVHQDKRLVIDDEGDRLGELRNLWAFISPQVNVTSNERDQLRINMGFADHGRVAKDSASGTWTSVTITETDPVPSAARASGIEWLDVPATQLSTSSRSRTTIGFFVASEGTFTFAFLAMLTRRSRLHYQTSH
jgi:hypothetical protein